MGSIYNYVLYMRSVYAVLYNMCCTYTLCDVCCIAYAVLRDVCVCLLLREFVY